MNAAQLMSCKRHGARRDGFVAQWLCCWARCQATGPCHGLLLFKACTAHQTSPSDTWIEQSKPLANRVFVRLSCGMHPAMTCLRLVAGSGLSMCRRPAPSCRWGKWFLEPLQCCAGQRCGSPCEALALPSRRSVSTVCAYGDKPPPIPSPWRRCRQHLPLLNTRWSSAPPPIYSVTSGMPVVDRHTCPLTPRANRLTVLC